MSLDWLKRLFPSGLEDPAALASLAAGSWAHVAPAELADVLGQCLWDIVANNHEVLAPGGSEVDFGSFRASAALIAEFRSQGVWDRARVGYRDYLDFYMGTYGIPPTADLTGFYRLIFTRMREADLEWRYVHPRIYLVDIGDGGDRSDEVPFFARYDPSASFQRQLEEARQEERLAELRAELDRIYEDSVRAARGSEPPGVVKAYREVYGSWPAGWPP